MNMFRVDVSTMAAPKTLDDKQRVGIICQNIIRNKIISFNVVKHGANMDQLPNPLNGLIHSKCPTTVLGVTILEE